MERSVHLWVPWVAVFVCEGLAFIDSIYNNFSCDGFIKALQAEAKSLIKYLIDVHMYKSFV